MKNEKLKQQCVISDSAKVDEFLKKISILPDYVQSYLKDYLYLTDFDLECVQKELFTLQYNLKRGLIIEYLVVDVCHTPIYLKETVETKTYYFDPEFDVVKEGDKYVLNMLTDLSKATLDGLNKILPKEPEKTPEQIAAEKAEEEFAKQRIRDAFGL